MHSPSPPIYTPAEQIALTPFSKALNAPRSILQTTKRGLAPIEEPDLAIEHRSS